MTKVVFQFSGKMVEYLINYAGWIAYQYRKTEDKAVCYICIKINPKGLKT